MTNEKFTPGPWRYEQGSRNPWAPCIVSAHRTEYGEETMVVNLQGAMGGDDVNADARLIAAAPALFEALARLRTIGARISVHKHAGLTVTNEDWSEMHEALNTARAALSAARGES